MIDILLFHRLLESDSLFRMVLSLLNKYSIVTVSGESFGSNDNIRLSYATSDEILDDALNKIEIFVNNLI